MARTILLYVVMTTTDDDPTDIEDLEEIIADVLNGKRGPSLDWCQGLEGMAEEYRPNFIVKARQGD